MSESEHTTLVITKFQAEKIVRKHLGGYELATISKFREIVNTGHGYTPSTNTYLIDIQKPGAQDPSSCFLTISTPDQESGIYHRNFLPIVNQILTRIRTQTEIPIPQSTLDISMELVPYHYLLSPPSPILSSDFIPLSVARESGILSPTDIVLIDLQMGKFLGQLHSGVQNDWFGLPELSEPADASYSWQETFTSLLESQLVYVESVGLDLPYEDIRGCLSRAIGFFLFDDVEVPSLVWFTGSEDDIYIALPSESKSLPIKSPAIAAILPSVSHALWGDPLLESFFMTEPSTALLEGYVGSGGGPLTVFPRQKTKRIWYTLFLALLVLKEHGVKPRNDDTPSSAGKRQWCTDVIDACVMSLKDAPNY